MEEYRERKRAADERLSIAAVKVDKLEKEIIIEPRVVTEDEYVGKSDFEKDILDSVAARRKEWEVKKAYYDKAMDELREAWNEVVRVHEEREPMDEFLFQD